MINKQANDLIQLLPIPIAWINPSGIILNCNNLLAQFLGSKKQDLIDTPIAQYFQTLEHEQLILEQMISQGELKNQELSLKNQNGKEIIISITTRGHKNEQEEIIGYFAVLNDITTYKSAEKALRMSEQLLARAQEIAHLGSWELDLVHNVLTWSDEVYRIFGLKPQEFGATYEAFLDAVHPDDRAAVDAAYSSSLREGRDSYEIEHRVVRKSSGEIRIVHERCQHIRDQDGKIILSVGMVHDITDRKRAEAALVESELKYRRVFETSNDAIMLLDQQKFFDCNEATLKVFGYSTREEFLGKHPSQVSPPYQADGTDSRIAADQKIVTAFQKGKNFFEWIHRRADGSDFPAEVLLTPMDFHGQQVLQATVRDITFRKLAENEVKAKSERLEILNRTLELEHQKLLNLTEQLTQLNEELKRLSEAKSEFVAAASHELRTPLTTIMEAIRLTEDGAFGPLTDEQRKYFHYAHEEAQRLRDLINNLLDVAKIERGKIEVKPTKVDVAEQLQKVKTNYGAFAKEKSLEIIIEKPESPVFVLCDANHYHRILTNLVGNAIKFTPSGGKILLRAEKLSNNIIKTLVRDTGLGIPKDQQYRIFQKFEPINRSANEPQTGTGLGLAICKQLVELNNGTIGFESEEHKGSTFFFQLPIYSVDTPPRNQFNNHK
jgi:PAS domain S-box-containing protein